MEAEFLNGYRFFFVFDQMSSDGWLFIASWPNLDNWQTEEVLVCLENDYTT